MCIKYMFDLVLGLIALLFLIVIIVLGKFVFSIPSPNTLAPQATAFKGTTDELRKILNF